MTAVSNRKHVIQRRPTNRLQLVKVATENNMQSTKPLPRPTHGDAQPVTQRQQHLRTHHANLIHNQQPRPGPFATQCLPKLLRTAATVSQKGLAEVQRQVHTRVHRVTLNQECCASRRRQLGYRCMQSTTTMIGKHHTRQQCHCVNPERLASATLAGDNHVQRLWRMLLTIG